jgi:hypothetical protein
VFFLPVLLLRGFVLLLVEMMFLLLLIIAVVKVDALPHKVTKCIAHPLTNGGTYEHTHGIANL